MESGGTIFCVSGNRTGGRSAVARTRVRAEAAERWGLGPRWAEALFLLPLAGSVAVILSRVYKPLFEFLLEEDRLFEWLQVVGFLLTAVIAGLLVPQFWRDGHRVAAASYVLLALTAFFIAGEEISWGQRVFDIQTPEQLAEINKQGETTLHNIGRALTVFNLVMLVVGFYGSIVAGWLRLQGSRARGPVFDVFVPPLFLTSWFFVLFVYRALRFSVFSVSRYTVFKTGEWAEFCLAFAVSTWLVLIWLRRRGEERGRREGYRNYPSASGHEGPPHGEEESGNRRESQWQHDRRGLASPNEAFHAWRARLRVLRNGDVVARRP